MIELTRREMYQWGAAAIGGVAALGGWGLYRTNHRMVQEILLAELPGLNVAPLDLRQFEVDFLSYYYPLTQPQRIGLRGVSSAAGIIGLNAAAALFGYNARIQDMRRAIVTAFLSNSDFFYLQDYKTETVSYWGLDPRRPCNNPFARFD